MDTNNQIIGIVFEIDKEAYDANIKKGISSVRSSRLAAKSISIFNSDNSKHEYISLSNYSENAKETKIMECLKNTSQAEIASYYTGDPRLIDSIDRAQNHKEYLSTTERDDVTTKVINSEKKKYGSGKKVASLAVLTGAVVLALSQCGLKKEENEPQEEKSIEIQLEDQDWEYYLLNMSPSIQKQLYINGADFAKVNASEDWMKLALTEEEMKDLGYTDSECIFGFTAEEIQALALRYNPYSKDDYVTLTGGKEMDVTTLVNSPNSISNIASKKIQAYYFLSDECNLDIEKILTFTEDGQNKVDEIETLFKEFKVLEKDSEKEKEAFDKMIEIKSSILSCAMDAEFDKNAKSYILEIFAPTASRISQMHQYKNTIEIEVYDTKDNKNVTKEIKTDLFDEITNRILWLGFEETESMGAFDAESFLENHNVSPSRYNLLNVDVESSMADQICGAQAEKLIEANEYIATLRQDNLLLETQAAITQGIDLSQNGVDINTLNNVHVAYDTLTGETYDTDVIMNLLNDYLKENNEYPKNIDYFLTTMMSKRMEEYKNTHGVTQGKVGDIVKTETKTQIPVTPSQLKDSNATVLNHAGEKVTADEAMEEARQENVEQTGIADASTPEASVKADEDAQQNAATYAAMLDNVFNATYNHYYGQNVYSTTSGYDANWANSSNSDVVANHNDAMNSALSRKNQEAAAAQANQQQQNQTPIIDQSFTNAEMHDQPQAPVPSVDNTTPSETIIVPETQPEIQPDNNVPEIDIPGFENAEIEGDIIVGEQTAVQITPENQTQTTLPTTIDSSSVNIIDIESVDSVLESLPADMTDEEFEQYLASGGLYQDVVATQNEAQYVKTK